MPAVHAPESARIMAVRPQYGRNPIPPRCQWGKKTRDDLSGQRTYEDLTVFDDDGNRVVANDRHLDINYDDDGYVPVQGGKQ
jgi:hypothetical protein